MATKAWLFLSLIVVLFIASEVAARNLAGNSAENKNKEKEEKMQTEQSRDEGPGGYGSSRGGYGGRGSGYCQYGCCYTGYYGGCSRCCAYAGEAVQVHQGSTEPAH
ncbi:hypothetical protein AALP_AA3G363100 [Arabis alpina]|uniref:Glycine-rich protein n=1 Tax=Arabis alpina TaxID=50452 RepID=A0A087HE01_ARAAL|nr:hypothetical protein AALP_AA3G363100 [Arabis alpina]